MKFIFTLIFLATFLLSFSQATTSPAATFTPGNIVVYRIGDGTTTLSAAASAVFLDEYTPAGVIAQSVPLPTTVSGANRALTSGINANEGKMTRSADGQYLIVPGYDAAVGSDFSGSTATDFNRVVGRVDFNGTVNTTTALNDAFVVGNFYSAASDNGNNFWLAGTDNQLLYTTLGASVSSDVAATPASISSVHIFNGQLYIGIASGTRIDSIGTGTPTTSGNALNPLTGVSTTGSVAQFFLADINPAVAGDDVLYMTVPPGTNGIAKYSFDGTSWLANGSLPAGTSVLRGLTGTVSGTSVTLYASSATNIFSLADASGYNNLIAGTYNTVATAAGNTQFRGVALTPVASALPLILTGNTISFNGAATEIKWITAHEEGVKGFAIERSLNGTSFTQIGYVSAKNSGVVYTYIYNDENVKSGVNFYRLRIEDKDGNIKYSSVMVINNKAQIKLSLYPNPVPGVLTITHPKAHGNSLIQLTNIKGELLNTYPVKEGAMQTAISLNQLNKGNYILIFNNGFEKISASFIKQ